MISTNHLLEDIEANKCQEYLHLLLSNSEESFFMVDKDLQLILFNNTSISRARQFFGIELIIGMPALDIVKPERRKVVLKWLNDTFAGKSQQTESVIELADGNRHFFLNSFKPARNEQGEIVAAIFTARDITEKKLTELKLQQSEEQYRMLFKNNPLPAWIYDAETLHFLEVNDAAIRFYGYSREEFLQLTLKSIRPEEDSLILSGTLKNPSEKINFLNNQSKHRKKNGEMVHVEVNANDIVYNEKPARLVMVNDITTKVELDNELIKSTERFLLASKATSDAIWDWDILHNDLKWGEGIFILFGHYEKDVPMQKWSDLIHADDRQKVLQNLDDTLNNPEASFWRSEYRFQNAKGAYRYILDHGYIVRDRFKKAIRMIGAMKDISELKEKEQALSNSIERYNIIAKATHDMIWDWDVEAGEIYRDPEGVKKVYGVASNESIKRINEWLKRIHPEDAPKLQYTLKKALKSVKKETLETEYRFRRDDGTYSYVYNRGYIMRNDNGKPYRLIGAAQDITERKRLEHELFDQQINEQRAINQATIDAQEAERREIGKELHDNVNQVLTTTKLYLDLAATKAELKDDLISKSSKNIIYVINEIRQLSRSLMLPTLGDLGLIDSINDLVENINATDKLRSTFLVSSFAEDMLEENQKLMILRIIQEALNNILKHAEATIATVHLFTEKNRVALIIKDDGKGFNLQAVKPGAGLNSIRNRVYLLNGKLAINTLPGTGCEIIIDIPLNTNPT